MDFAVFDNVNIWAVLVSAVAYWLLGALWYSPMLFAKAWQKHVNFQEEWRKGMGMTMILSLVGMIVICFALAVFINHLVYTDITRSLKIAILAGIGLMAMPIWINHLYSKKSATLFLIDAGYHFVGFLIAAVILSLWR